MTQITNSANEADQFSTHFIVAAAGSGSRFGGLIPKAFIELRDGRSLVELVVRATRSFSLPGKTVVLVPPRELAAARERFADLSRDVVVEAGGESRQESIVRGLDVLGSIGAQESDLVVVHDAARCVLPRDATLHLIAVARETGAATLAVPVTDALCRSHDSVMISAHVPREGLWSIQTPQAFRLELLRRAHDNARATECAALDDSELVAKIQDVSIVRGARTNVKVTYSEDLAMVEALAASNG